MKYIEKTLAFGAAFCLFVVFGVVFAQVFQRYLLNISLPWGTDVIRIAFVYSVFLGMTLGVIKKSHLNIDFLVHSLPAEFKPLFDLLANIVMGAFLATVLNYSFSFIAQNTDQMMPYLNLSMSWVYAIIPICTVVMLLSLLQDTALIILGRREA